MPAKIANPRKQFQFTVIIPGLNPFLAQEVKLPDSEIDIVEHGDTNFMVKTGGMKKVGQLTVNKIKPADSLDTYMKSWQNRIQNTFTGGGQLPSQYKVSVIVEEFGNDGITVIERHQYLGCWPQKRNGVDLSRKGSDNTTESIEFCVDEELPF